MTTEQALIGLYKRAAAKLRQDIARALAANALASADYRARQLAAVLRQLQQLQQRTRPLTLQLAASHYLAGAQAVDLAGGATARAAFAFTGGQRQAVNVIAQNLALRLENATTLVGRRTDDVFRRVALERVGIGIAAGEARRDVSASIEQRLVAEGLVDALTGKVDLGHKRWQLDTYAEMVARTTTREAVSAGTEARMRQTGQRLVAISTHPNPCPICVPFDGGVFSLPGLRVAGYKTIDRLPPFHPNCLHVCAPSGDEEGFLAALQQLLRTG